MGHRGSALVSSITAVVAVASLSFLSFPGSAQEPIMVDFGFVPSKASYAPGEGFTIEFTVTNMLDSEIVAYDEYANKVKVMNVSAHFSWMLPDEEVREDVSEESSWLEPEAFETYLLPLRVPDSVSSQTYNYVIWVDYLLHTPWANISYTWGGMTYWGFEVSSPTGIPGEEALEDTEFVFCPGKLAYAPGDNVTIELIVVNSLDSGGDDFDELAYMVKVVNISTRFSWMPPGAYLWADVSDESSWLAPDGEGIGTYTLQMTVPEDIEPQTYSYLLRVEYLVHTREGNISYVWGGGIQYRDFTVAEQAVVDGEVDYGPYIAAAIVILVLGAVGAVLYYSSQKKSPQAAGVQAASPAPPPSEGYPVILAVPGERFPVERGFIYLVKEKRPVIAFQMFNEATSRGAKGMLVVREHPDRMMEQYKFDAKKILWLTRRVGKDHADPTELSLLSHKISRFVDESGRSVVLLEGLEYMITQNDFETVLRFVNHLHDFVLSHDCAVIVVVDPRILSTRELALLERAAKVVEPSSGVPEEEPPVQREEAEA